MSTKPTFQEARRAQARAIRRGWRVPETATKDPVRDPKTGNFPMQFRFSLEEKGS